MHDSKNMKARRYSSRILILLLSLAISTMACSTSEIYSLLSFDPTDEASSEPEPLSTESPSFEPTDDPEVLLFDDFSDLNSGWEAEDSEVSRYYYSEGEYFIEAFNDLSYYYIVSGDSFQDGILQVETRHVSGDVETTGVMVFWRYLDEDNFYALTVYGNGSYNIHRFLHGTYGLISLPTISPALKTGEETNKIIVSMHGDTTEIFFNDIFAYSFSDPAIKAGSVGLGVSPDRSSPVSYAFDNLAINTYHEDSNYLPIKPEPTPIPEYRSITWAELVQFLADDHTNWHEYDLETYNCVNYAVDLAVGAEQERIKTRLVGVDFIGQETGHAFVEFETSDRGIIFVEPQGDNTYSNVKLGNLLCDDWGEFECMGVIDKIHYFGACDHEHHCTVDLSQN